MHKYRVVIVDDEKPIVEGLKAFIDWETEGFIIVGTASNGKDGLDMAIKMKADVVLTDIRMPLLNGNDLISQMKKVCPDCEFVVLSGYSSFDYAQKAINDGAVCYLLKPVQEEELLQNLRSIRKKLDNKNSIREEMDNLRNTVVEMRPVIEARYLHELLTNGFMNSTQILEKWHFLRPNDHLDCYAIMSIETEGLDRKYSTDIEKMIYISDGVSNLIEGEANATGIGVAYNLSKDREIIICTERNGVHLLLPELEKWGKYIQKQTEALYGENISIGLSCIHHLPEELSTAMKEAERALEYRLVFGSGSVILFDTLSDETETEKDNRDKEKELIQYVEKTDDASIKMCLTQLFKSIEGNGEYSPEAVYAVYVRIIVSVYQYAEQRGILTESMRHQILDALTEIRKFRNVDILIEHISGQIFQITELIRIQRAQRQKGVVGEIQEYVDKHYSENISLDFIEQKFYINASYLSYQFKKKVGKNFIDYLTDVRIENAKRLLPNPDIKIYEVGEMVGYSSPRYFSQIFEKRVGITPSKYRQQFLPDE